MHLDLRENKIGTDGTESLAGVLGQCAALANLNLGCNGIAAVGKGRLRGSWRGQAIGLLLEDLDNDEDEDEDEDEDDRCRYSGLLAKRRRRSLHCLLLAICLADRQQERATYCAHTVW